MNAMVRSLALLLLLLAAGCGDDATGPGDAEERDPAGPFLDDPVALPVLGQGAITGRFSAELWVSGSTAYTTTWGNRGGRTGNTVYLWDVAGPQPVLLDSLTIENATTLGDVEVVQRPGASPLLVVATERANGSIVLYDLANPRAPVRINRYISPNTRAGVHTAEIEFVDGTLYGFLSIDPDNSLDGSPAKLVVVDLTNPLSPREVFVQAMGRPFVHDVFVRDGYLFTANWDEGLAIWSIGAEGSGSPASPVRLATAATIGGNVHNVWWFHDPRNGEKRYAFVGEEQTPPKGSAGDIHVVDVSDPRAPREVAFFTVPGAGTHNFWVDEARGVLYAAYYNGGVRAINVRGDLSTCTDAQKSDADHTAGTTLLCDLDKMGRAVGVGLNDAGRNANVWGVQQVGDVLYASDMNNGLWALDLTPLYRALGR